jgi:hypothetical protein
MRKSTSSWTRSWSDERHEFSRRVRIRPRNLWRRGRRPARHDAAVEQQRQQQGVDFGSTPNVAPNFSPETSFSPQGGLLGRLLALQAEQARQQPFAGNSGAAPLRSLDPNFGQLSRAPVASRMQGAIDVPNPSVDQAGPTPAGGGTSFDSLSATAQRGGLLGAYRGTPVPPWIVSSPAMTPVPLGWRGRGIPMPPMGPARLPPVPLPAVPEWWKTAWKILQFDPTNWSGRGDGGNDDYRRCIRAADGRTND